MVAETACAGKVVVGIGAPASPEVYLHDAFWVVDGLIRVEPRCPDSCDPRAADWVAYRDVLLVRVDEIYI